MDQRRELLERTYEVVRGPVALLEDRLLDRPTPCHEWSLGQLFDHLVGAIHMFASAAGAPPSEDAPVSPLARFDAAATRNLAAWATVDDPEAPLSLPFGEFPAALAAGINQLDTLVHGWDVAVSLGAPLVFPDDLATVAFETAQRSVPPFRGHGFGAALPARGEAPGERLLAFTGRDVSAWPGAIWIAGSLVTLKSAPTIGDGPPSAVEVWEREGSGPPRHVHAQHDELWYVLEGEFTFSLGDREIHARPGDVVVGPRGVPHTFRADAPRSRVLDIHTPGGFERFFVLGGQPAAALAPPPPSPVDGPPNIRVAFEDFGVSVVGPPLSS